jgi:hypothetical protein
LRKRIVIGKVLRSRRHLSTQNFELDIKIILEINKVISVREWKLQHMNVVTFHSELIMRHEYRHWRDIAEKNAFKESDYRIVH